MSDWISVNDKIPQMDEYVSISVTGNKANVGYFHNRGHWIICCLSGSYRQSGMHKVTHWMPLPAPPE